MTKRIPIDELRPGMYVVGLDKSWWQTPFLSHKWTVRGSDDIARLREAGVKAVDIDPTQGGDVEVLIPSITESLAAVAEAQGSADHPTPSTVVETQLAPPPATSQSLITDIAEAMPAARATRKEALAILEKIFDGVKISRPIDSPAIKHAVSSLLAAILHRPEASLLLTQMQRLEADLLAHSLDVCVLALVIGKQQQLPEEQLVILGIGAMLHDIGKTRLPRNLLRQASGYTPQAQKLLNEHPRLGVSLLSHNKEIEKEVLRIIAEHHERADGSGFPKGCTATDLSPLSQLVGIIDLYERLVSGHSGQVAYLPTQALRHLYKLGQTGALLSEQVAWVIRTLGVYPIGAVVELNTGERGIIVSTKADESLKPTVYVVCNTEGQLLAEPRLVDLLTPPPTEPVQRILRPLEAKAIPFSLADYFQNAT